jgi:hypothetical protein
MRRAVLILAFVAAGVTRLPAETPALAPEQQARFLLTARIISHKDISAAGQTASIPMYFGQDPRNGLTLKSGDALATLRVSAHGYDKFKAALLEHNVRVSEAK